MPDRIASNAIEFLVQVLEQDADLLGEMQGPVRTLVAALLQVRSYLVPFEARLTDGSEMSATVTEIKAWVRQAEAAIDAYIIRSARERRRQQQRRRLGRGIFCAWRKAGALREATAEIARIESLMKEVCPKIRMFCEEYHAAGGGGLYSPPRARGGGHSNVEDADQIVGFADEAEGLAKLLTTEKPNLRVMGITGMEGAGKTTLAKRIYNDVSIRRHFGCRAWVSVSQHYKIEELLLNILNQVRSSAVAAAAATAMAAALKDAASSLLPNGPVESEAVSAAAAKGTALPQAIESGEEEIGEPFSGPTTDEEKSHTSGDDELELPNGAQSVPLNEEEASNLNEDELKEKLSQFLRGKRYLIVLDNVYTKDVWDELKPAFPSASNGSKILLTCRSTDVVSRAGISHHTVGRLSKEESWLLLSKKALGAGDKKAIGAGDAICPPELEQVGRHLAEKCSGIPGAIGVFGKILARREKKVDVWSRMVEDASSCIEQDWVKIVSEYDYLPAHLRFCFLYFSLFPENYVIPARQLIEMWIAEGFIKERGDRTMEEIGEEYLGELINRSYVQLVGNARRADGGVKACSTLSFLRDLCVYKGAAEEQLSKVFAFVHSSTEPLRKTQRLAIHGKSAKAAKMPELSGYSGLRSLHWFFNTGGASGMSSSNREHSARILRSLHSETNMLRVLNLGFVTVERIPDGLGRLELLRYLRINAPSLRSVPLSICKIRYLQTLDMRETGSLCVVPDGIWKLANLRHLYFSSCQAQLLGPEGKSYAIEPLQKLQTLSGIRPNRALKRLMVKAKFPNVRKLRLWSSSSTETLEFLESLDHLYYLQSLRIIGACDLPDPHAFPGTLAKITLAETKLEAKGMETLETLPNLRILKMLRNSFGGPEIYCGEGAFPQLQVLKLVDLKIKRWTVRRGGLRSLQHLVIEDCDRLETIPKDLGWLLTTIKVKRSPLISKRALERLAGPRCTVDVD